MTSSDPVTASEAKTAPRGLLGSLSDQFGFHQMISDYLIPIESNNFWYLLGGVLGIALAVEIGTGVLLSLVYVPDAGQAFGITQHLITTGGWSIVLNFHFYNSFVIFGLVMIHMVRVFITGSYRRGKTGLWLIGVGLAAVTFVISLTGEALHWDEVGFGVPWNVSEVLDAVGLAAFFGYTTDALLAIPTATEKLTQIYVLHISIVPIALGVLVGWHYLLIRFKGISTPFWLRASGRKAGFLRARPRLDHSQRGHPRRCPPPGDLRSRARPGRRPSFFRPRRSMAWMTIPADLDSSRPSRSAGRAA